RRQLRTSRRIGGIEPGTPVVPAAAQEGEELRLAAADLHHVAAFETVALDEFSGETFVPGIEGVRGALGFLALRVIANPGRIERHVAGETAGGAVAEQDVPARILQRRIARE